MFDHGIREFASPIEFPPEQVSAVTPPKAVVVTIPGLDEDHAFNVAVDALKKLPRAQRNAVVAFVLAWLKLRTAVRAVIAKFVQPHLSDNEVAVLCGVTLRTIQRSKQFQDFKPTLDDYLESKRRAYYMPEEPDDD